MGIRAAKPSEAAKLFMLKWWGLTMKKREKTFSRLCNWTLQCQMNFTQVPNTKINPNITAQIDDLCSNHLHREARFGVTWPYLGQHPLHVHIQNLRTQPHIAENSHMCTLTHQSPLSVRWKSLEGEEIFFKSSIQPMLTAKQSYTPDFQEEWGVEHQASSKHCSPSRSSMERWFTALKKKKVVSPWKVMEVTSNLSEL